MFSLIYIYREEARFSEAYGINKSFGYIFSKLCSWASWKSLHYDVIKWKHFSRNWPYVRGIHRSPVNSPHKGQWCGPLMFSLIFAWINGSVNNRAAGDLRRHRAHYDVIIMHYFAVHFCRSVPWNSNTVLNAILRKKFTTNTFLEICAPQNSAKQLAPIALAQLLI